MFPIQATKVHKQMKAGDNVIKAGLRINIEAPPVIINIAYCLYGCF